MNIDSHLLAGRLLMQPLDMMNQSQCSHQTRIKFMYPQIQRSPISQSYD